MPLSAAKIEDNTLTSGCSASKLMSSIFFYLLLSPSISFYLNLPTRQAQLAKLKLYYLCIDVFFRTPLTVYFLFYRLCDDV